MSDQIPRTSAQTFAYRRDKDGCDDVFHVIDHRGIILVSVRFWDEPDTNHAAEALELARLLAAAPVLLATLERFEATSRAAEPDLHDLYDSAREAIRLARSG
jgi:hypothetical protein